MSDNWDEDIPSEGMKAKIKRKCRVSFCLDGETRLTIKVFFILYFVSDPESESVLVMSPESESEPEQPHHDSAPLIVANGIVKTGHGVLSHPYQHR